MRATFTVRQIPDAHMKISTRILIVSAIVFCIFSACKKDSNNPSTAPAVNQDSLNRALRWNAINAKLIGNYMWQCWVDHSHPTIGRDKLADSTFSITLLNDSTLSILGKTMYYADIAVTHYFSQPTYDSLTLFYTDYEQLSHNYDYPVSRFTGFILRVDTRTDSAFFSTGYVGLGGHYVKEYSTRIGP